MATRSPLTHNVYIDGDTHIHGDLTVNGNVHIDGTLHVVKNIDFYAPTTMGNQALTYATAAHAAVGQRRKYTNEPYIVHPIRVATTVAKFGGTDEMISAAYLHDVVEDTGVSIEDILDMFGSVVAVIVDGLTNVSKPEDGNRAVRKELDREHSADATWAAQFVKCADIIDNAADISDNDPSFSVVYRKEKVLLLEVLDKVKDEPIYKAAIKALELASH